MTQLSGRIQLTALVALSALIVLFSVRVSFAETPPEQEVAINALRGIPSNLQKNRDGTVRFVRFSKAIVNDAHLSHVAAFQQLDYLAVVTPSVTDAGLQHIAGLTNLDTLYLSDSGLTDTAMPALKGLRKLERLYLDRTRVTDVGLAQIASLKSLKTVSLRETAVTDTGLAHLAGLENLEVLFLNASQVTDVGLTHLAELPNLRTLHLDEAGISGAGLEHLKSLPKLTELSLNKTPVTAERLVAIREFPALTQLHLLSTRMTTADVADLKSTLPKLNIALSPTDDNRLNAFQRLLAGESLRGVERTATQAVPTETAPEVPVEQVLAPALTRFTTTDEVPDFQRHVIPLLGRLGCNGRTCHGSFQGKGGFSLSMFGYDFDADLKALAGSETPRVNVKSPAESLILNKPTSEDDHGGGQRFKTGEWEYRLLERWIANGAQGVEQQPRKMARFVVEPAEIQFTKTGETVQLQCVAIWEDGTREDVTCLTRFSSNDDAVAEITSDGLITCKAPGDTYLISSYDNGIFSTQALLPVSDRTGDRFPKIDAPTEIDRLVLEKLKKLGIEPSELSADGEFLRRTSLDITGTLPTVNEYAAFVADPSPDKRARKIDELLESPAYAEWWAVKLADLTGSNSQYLGTTDMNTPASDQWNAWLRRRVQDNVGWDRIAAGIVLAESRRPGQTYDDFAAEQSRFLSLTNPSDFTAHENPMHYYWFRSNNQTPTDRALSFGYVFLGVRLQCAQCHKHPFDQWSKQDFEQFTEFFTRVKSGISPDAREAQTQLKSKLGVPVKLDTAALRRQMYLRVSAEGLPIPWNEIWIEKPGQKPQPAKLLGDTELDLNEFEDPREPLMAWLLKKDNRYFAPAFVNRVWHHYFGVGIVEPPDDFNMANPPSNKALLEWLSEQFVARGYDLKWLHRTIASSRTYQLSWRPTDSNRNDERNFSHSLIRRMPAEVTIDAILHATANDARAATWSSNLVGRKIGQHPKSIQARGIDYSLLVFGKPLRTTNCDCERQQQPTLLQSLYVRNDTELIEWLERKDGWLLQLASELKQRLSSDLRVPETGIAVKQGPNPDAAATAELVRAAYRRTLTREPTDKEIASSIAHIGDVENTVEGLRDLLWALLNTPEFLTNH